MSMDCKDFRLWRQKLALTQEGAALKFGLSRATIVNWENGTTPISPAVEAACQHFTREWKQRPEAGPVTLLYGDAPMALSNSGLAEFLCCSKSATPRMTPQFVVPSNSGTATAFTIR